MSAILALLLVSPDPTASAMSDFRAMTVKFYDTNLAIASWQACLTRMEDNRPMDVLANRADEVERIMSDCVDMEQAVKAAILVDASRASAVPISDSHRHQAEEVLGDLRRMVRDRLSGELMTAPSLNRH